MGIFDKLKNKKEPEIPVENQPQDVEIIPTWQNCIGYYADMNEDGIPEGIIYADLAIGTDGKKMWNDDSWTVHEYSAKRGLKKYYIINESYYKGDFGRKPMVAPVKNTIGRSTFNKDIY